MLASLPHALPHRFCSSWVNPLLLLTPKQVAAVRSLVCDPFFRFGRTRLGSQWTRCYSIMASNTFWWMLLLMPRCTISQTLTSITLAPSGYPSTCTPTPNYGCYFGNYMANLGDRDGDGVSDLAVSASRAMHTGNIAHEGVVYIFHMNNDGSVKSQAICLLVTRIKASAKSWRVWETWMAMASTTSECTMRMHPARPVLYLLCRSST